MWFVVYTVHIQQVFFNPKNDKFRTVISFLKFTWLCFCYNETCLFKNTSFFNFKDFLKTYLYCKCIFSNLIAKFNIIYLPYTRLLALWSYWLDASEFNVRQLFDQSSLSISFKLIYTQKGTFTKRGFGLHKIVIPNLVLSCLCLFYESKIRALLFKRVQ